MDEQERTKVAKPIQNLMITSKIPDDRDVLQKINELASVIPGLRAKDALKNFLLRSLPAEIERLRSNGGQLAARMLGALICLFIVGCRLDDNRRKIEALQTQVDALQAALAKAVTLIDEDPLKKRFIAAMQHDLQTQHPIRSTHDASRSTTTAGGPS
jgi:hypothetical protein